MRGRLRVKIGLENTGGTFVTIGDVRGLLILQLDKYRYRSIHGAIGIGEAVDRFCHHALEGRRQALQQEYDHAVKQHVPFSLSNDEVSLHRRIKNNQRERYGD